MPRPRPCIGHQRPCPTRALTTDSTGRCATCRRQRDSARGSREQRGYDHQHRQRRKAWQHEILTGTVLCRRCHQPIAPGAQWDLGHYEDRSLPTHPEHQSCNRATAGHPTK